MSTRHREMDFQHIPTAWDSQAHPQPLTEDPSWGPQEQWAPQPDHFADPDMVEQSHLSDSTPSRWPKARRGLFIRRAIGVAIILAFTLTLLGIIFFTNTLDPVFAQLAPVAEMVTWVKDDPKRAWAAAAVLVIPHLGLYFMIFENR